LTLIKPFFTLILLFSALFVYGARPTVHSSNLTFNNLTCNSVIIQWTSGNGSARVIVAKEGSTPDYEPVDGSQYSPNKDFGKSIEYGVKNYIVYNSNGTNFVKVDSLKPGKTYYFTIVEHDNNSNNTLYYVSNPPSISITTHSLNLNFNITYFDSCQQKNLYEFTNTSTASFSGVTYTFDFGNSNTSSSSPVQRSFTNAGLVPVRISANPSLGCPNLVSKNVRVYNKRVAFIDFNVFDDTVQCLDGNYFDIDPTPVTSPLLASYRYNWDFGDGKSSSFKRMKKTYDASGRYKVQLEILTNVNLQPTGCRDTLRFDLVVLPNPAGSVVVNQEKQCSTNNNFIFENPDNTLTFYKWYFSTGDSSSSRITSKSYNSINKFQVIHVAFSQDGCKGKDTIEVEVLENLDATFTGLDTAYCKSNNPVTLNTTMPNGVFSGYNIANNTLLPNTPGTYSLKYLLKDQYCADSTEQNFKISDNPQPFIGRDTAICSTGTYFLDANHNGAYLWNTGETSKTIGINQSGTYGVVVTQGLCKGSDSIQLIFSTVPVVNIGRDTILCKGGSLKLVATNPRSIYQWNTGSKDSFIYTFNSGKYKVTVSNPCGVASDSINISVQGDYCDLFMVNAFTPGNDLLNNVFMPRGRNITVKLFQIYNRWGELVFETDQNNVGWDGTYNNNNADMGLYIWKLFYTVPNGPFVKKSNAFGQILLIR
jgi:gliding motility-associated-like protein